MPAEGRDLSSRQTQDVARDREIGQPINSEERPEAAEGAWKEFRLGSGIAAVRDDGTDAAPACRFAVCLAVIALVADHCPGCDVRADVEQGLEITAVAGLAAGQVEGQGQAVEIAL